MNELARVVMHTLACLAFPILWMCGYEVWTRLALSAVAQGHDVALATLLVFYTFVAMNVLMALTSRTAVRLGLAVVLALMVILYLLPSNPLRGVFLMLLSAGLSCAAIMFSFPLSKHFEKCFSRWRPQT